MHGFIARIHDRKKAMQVPRLSLTSQFTDGGENIAYCHV